MSNHKREILDDDDIKSIQKHCGLVHGKAGTGKSTTLDTMKNTNRELNHLSIIKATTEITKY